MVSAVSLSDVVCMSLGWEKNTVVGSDDSLITNFGKRSALHLLNRQ